MKQLKTRQGIFAGLFLLCGFSALTLHADARKLNWNTTTGGALDLPSNWLINGTKTSPEAFFTDDAIRIRATQSADMTLENDLAVGSCALGGSSYGSVGMTWNLGAARKLTFSSGTVMTCYTNSHLTVSSGTVELNGNVLTGSDGGATDWMLTGSDTRMTCSGTFSIGYGKSGTDVICEGNTFSISNGASYTGGARLGHGGSKHNTAILAGAGSTWTSSSAILLGIAATAAHNTLWVTDGACLDGDVTIGTTAGTTHNVLILSGAGTTWKRPDAPILIGCTANNTDYSSLVISNELSYTTAENVRVGVDSDGTHKSTYCRFVVTDKAKAYVPNIYTYGEGNGVDIEGGAELFLTDTSDSYLNIGSATLGGGVWNVRSGGKFELSGTRCNVRFYKGSAMWVDAGNVSIAGQVRQGSAKVGVADTYICVTNGGVFTVSGTTGLYVGHEVASSNNVFEVRKGGTLSLPNVTPIIVGNADGYRNKLVVDGGMVMCENSPIRIGAQTNNPFATAMSGENALIVKNGGSVTCETLYVGYTSPKGLLEIDNGTLTAKTIVASHEGSATHAAAINPLVRVAGAAGKLVALSNITFSASSTLVLDITATRETSLGALITGKSITFAKGAKIRITSSDPTPSRYNAKTITALESAKDIDLTGVTLEIDSACGLTRVNDGDATALRFRTPQKSGFTVFIR